MFKVIARFKQFEGKKIQPYYVYKIYKTLQHAKNFIEKNIDHPKFNFEMEEIS